jgi:hypothetical protein
MAGMSDGFCEAVGIGLGALWRACWGMLSSWQWDPSKRVWPTHECGQVPFKTSTIRAARSLAITRQMQPEPSWSPAWTIWGATPRK